MKLKSRFQEQDLIISKLGLTEDEVRQAGKNEHPNPEVNKAVQAALLTRQRVIDVMAARAKIKGVTAANNRKAAIDSTVLELVPVGEDNYLKKTDTRYDNN